MCTAREGGGPTLCYGSPSPSRRNKVSSMLVVAIATLWICHNRFRLHFELSLDRGVHFCIGIISIPFLRGMFSHL